MVKKTMTNRRSQTNQDSPVTELETESLTNDQFEKLKEAESLLQADREARAKQFLAELQVLCQKYRCELTPMLNVVAK